MESEPIKTDCSDEKLQKNEDDCIKIKKAQKRKPKEKSTDLLKEESNVEAGLHNSTNKTTDKKRNDYELAEYLMIDLDYRAKNLGAFKSEKKLTHFNGTNLTDPNMVATSLSLNKSKSNYLTL